MQNEIEAQMDDRVFYAVRDKFEKFDSDNANTEQVIGVNEVEAMIDSAIEEKVDEGVRNAIDDLDFNMLIRDYGDVDSLIEDFVYNNDLVDKCWVEDELSKVHRDVRDEVLSEIREEIDTDNNDVESRIFHATARLEAQIMGMQAEIDFLHEKYTDLYNRRFTTRVKDGADRAALIVKRAAALVLAIIPTISWKKGN